MKYRGFEDRFVQGIRTAGVEMVLIVAGVVGFTGRAKTRCGMAVTNAELPS